MCIPLSQVPRALLNTAISNSSLAAFRLTSLTASQSRRLTPHLSEHEVGLEPILIPETQRSPEMKENVGLSTPWCLPLGY